MKGTRQRLARLSPPTAIETRAGPSRSRADPDYITLDDSDEEERSAPSLLSEKSRGKKRKISDDTDSDSDSENGNFETVPKKPRLDPGLCSKFNDIIEDVQLEIIELLDPIDLLNLVRSNRNLRDLVNGATSTWKNAFARFPGLPECPPDITPLKYTDLMFGKDCQFCRKNLPAKSMHTSWSARVRACKQCLKLKWIHSPKPAYPTILYKCLPWIDVGGKQMVLRYYYDKEIHESWQTEWKNAPNKSVWTAEKIKEWKARIEHGKSCEKWAQATWRDRIREKELKFESRRAFIMKHLDKQEWAEELRHIPDDQIHPLDTKEVTRACQNPITKKSLSKVLLFLKELLETSKANRLERERSALLTKSLLILSKILKEYSVNSPLDALYPNACELVRDPLVKQILDKTPLAELCAEDFRPIVPLFPVIISKWKERVDAKLVQLIADGCRRAGIEYTFNPVNVLQLATTTFSCAHCNSRCDGKSSEQSIRYPRVMMHSCAYKPKLRKDEDADEVIMHDVLQEGYWNARGDITFDVDNLKILTEAVKVCGFNPGTNTVAEIEVVKPILECDACSDNYTGRFMMELSTVPNHYRQKHFKDFPMELALIKDAGTLELVRTRMLEERERQISRRNYHNMICVYCRQRGNVPGLIEHVDKVHNISNPGRQDIGHVFDSDHTLEVCHLWPPKYLDKNGCVREIALQDIARH